MRMLWIMFWRPRFDFKTCFILIFTMIILSTYVYNELQTEGDSLQTLDVASTDGIEQMQQERLHRLESYCRTHTRQDTEMPWKYFYVVDSERKLVYGWVPKVLSSTLFYAMLYSRPEFRGHHPDLNFDGKGLKTFYRRERERITSKKYHSVNLETYGMKSLQSFPEDTVRDITSSYYLFIIVRNPYTRLASAYSNLMRDANASASFWSTHYSRMMIKMYPDFHLSSKTPELTFSDFLMYVTDPSIKNQDMHWLPYYSLLLPCDLKYSYIAKKETIGKEWPHLQAIMDKNNTYMLGDMVTSNRGYSSKNIDRLYQPVHKNIIKRVVSTFQADFEMFGYDKSQYLRKNRTISKKRKQI